VAFTLVRLFGLEVGPLVQVVPFTPYLALAALIPVAVAIAGRRWWAAGIAAAAGLTLAALVVPRATSPWWRCRAATITR
jgi:hypothetical protein